MVKYYVYIIKCEKWIKGIPQGIFYYTGMSSNPKRRLKEHQNGIRSKWMKKYGMKALYFIHMELIENGYYSAVKREKQIKDMSVINKLKLAHSNVSYGNASLNNF